MRVARRGIDPKGWYHTVVGLSRLALGHWVLGGGFKDFFHVHPYLSNEKNPGWLGYIGDYTTQLYRDYNKPL